MVKLPLTSVKILLLVFVGIVRCVPDIRLRSPVCMQQPKNRILIPWDRRNEQEGVMDLLNMEPPKYLENYKNPCWIQDVHGKERLRCFPYFFIAGFTKSGTTDLWARIGLHPDISTEHQRKEPHWFSERRFLEPEKQSIDMYTKMFGRTASDIENGTILRDGKEFHHKITGDATPGTIWKMPFWRQIPQNTQNALEPCIVHAHVIKHLLPNAKIILSLRNPISHLFSIYEFFKAYEAKGPTLFHNFCLKQILHWNKCIEKNTWRQCAYDAGYPTQQEDRFAMTMHAAYIKDWLEVFPREQIHIVQLEEYAANQTKVMEEIFKFLDVGPVSNMDQITAKPVYNKRRTVGKTILDKTIRLMNDFYRPYKKALSELLGDDKWMYEQPLEV